MVSKAVGRHKGKRKQRKERKRIEEAVQYALAHHTRLEILILLNEAAYTTSEVAELTGIGLKHVPTTSCACWMTARLKWPDWSSGEARWSTGTGGGGAGIHEEGS